MPALSSFLENKLLDHILGPTAYSKPSTIYVALFNADPTENNTSAEISTSGTGYSRKAVTFGTAASGGIINNTSEVLFDVALTSWSTVSHLALFDAATGGSMLFHAPLSSSKLVSQNDQLKFGVSQIAVSLD